MRAWRSASAMALALGWMTVSPEWVTVNLERPLGTLPWGHGRAVALDDVRRVGETNARLTADELARLIDSSLAARWAERAELVAPDAADAEFLRRAYLDLVGKTPAVMEARQFLDDTAPDKRARLIDALLSRGAFATHWANVWRELLLSGTSNAAEARALAPPLEAWLRLRFAEGVPYDQLVRELLTARSSGPARRANRGGGAPAQPSPLAFYLANQRQPEQLAASTSRVFLGTQLQCAQCHDHPFARWSRGEFWSFAAFFTGLGAAGDEADPASPVLESLDHDAIRIPETDILADPRYLDGERPDWRPQESKRVALARWLTADANPYFAQALVNRMFDLLLGRGFVTPVDDLDPNNPPVLPDLFEAVTRQFVLHGYDLKYLIRAIMLSTAYQRSSQATVLASEEDLPPFARMPLRRLSSDQLYDSLVQATGYRDPPPTAGPAARGMAPTRADFQNRFAHATAGRGEAETSILQALALMNGRLTTAATTLERSETLSAVVHAPFLTDQQRVETLFLAALARRPSEDESRLAQALLDETPPDRGRPAALADLFWALLNSTEFAFNH